MMTCTAELCAGLNQPTGRPPARPAGLYTRLLYSSLPSWRTVCQINFQSLVLTFQPTVNFSQCLNFLHVHRIQTQMS